MTAKRQVWASRIDFRPDPGDPVKNIINLGFLLEFNTKEYWVVAMIMLATIDDAALSGVDELSRKLIESRQKVIENEIRRVLPRANKLGEVLPLLAAANPWSMHIAVPTAIDTAAVRNVEATPVEKLAEKYALSLFVRDDIAARASSPAHPGAVRAASGGAPRIVVPDDCPAPWLLPPACVMRPLHVR